MTAEAPTAIPGSTVLLRHRIGDRLLGEPEDERRNPARPQDVVAATPRR